jgi:hypothetical protein
MQVEQQRFLVQPFSILTNNHAARASSSMVTATSAAGSSAADADEQAQEAAALRDGYSQHLRQQQLMRQRRRQLQLQQQQQAVYMQRSAAQAGFTPEEASRLAAQAYWGSGVTTGLLRPGGMYGAPAGLLGPEPGLQWPYRGPLASTAAADAGYGRQQQDMLIAAADGDAQSKRRQQGRLGRMASRIYALRPRLRKSDGTGERTLSGAAAGPGAGAAASAQQPGSAAVGMYKQISASFKSGIAALTVSDAAAAADDALAAGGGAAGADGTEAAAAAVAVAAASGASYNGGVEAPVDLSNTPAVLKSLGLPPDTAVVGPQYYIGGPQGPAAKYSSLNPRCAHQAVCCWQSWCCSLALLAGIDCQPCLVPWFDFSVVRQRTMSDNVSVSGLHDYSAPVLGLPGTSAHACAPQSRLHFTGLLMHAGVSCSPLLLVC